MSIATVSTGYICKQCGGPSPVGIGYATSVPRNTTVEACPCGYSAPTTEETIHMPDEEQTHTRSINLAPTPEGKAWYGGMAAGASALEFAEAAGDNWDARIGMYWLHVGSNFQERFPDGTAEMHAKYVEGAALHAPTRPQPLVQVTIPTSVADYYTDDTGELNEDALSRALEAILATIGGRFGREDIPVGTSTYEQSDVTVEFNL